uniref:Uncharacterized protein n=1 Tax=Rhizophagus irregularis (strain DAOM 181602 / DAOM 197198 / MUCL 43194) TaxID=747089 RepID=U9T0Q5_RHIID
MESILTRKRKADEIDNGQDVDRVVGIVTDASEWYFMECSLDNEGKPSFKPSEPEAQKPVEARAIESKKGKIIE